jgi:hypothetical protein
MNESLYSAEPSERIITAEKLDGQEKEEILRRYRPWLVKDYGAANAWAVVVGPSGGVKKRENIAEQLSLWARPNPMKRLALGEVHEWLEMHSQQKSVFWKNLLGALEVAFTKGNSIDCQSLNHLKAILTTHLSPEQVVDEAEISDGELLAGMPHFLELLRLCKPRVVVALTKRVYDLLSTYPAQKKIGTRMRREDQHMVKNSGAMYWARSCWMSIEHVGSFLLLSLPQHPNRAETFGGYYVPSVGAYLGRRFRAALNAPSSEPKPFLIETFEMQVTEAGKQSAILVPV